MVRQHHQPGGLERREVAERPGAFRADLVAVAQRGGVAVMAVGDVRPLRRQDRLHLRHDRGRGEAPEPVDDSAVVGVHRERLARGRRPGRPCEVPAGVGEHQEDRAEVRARGLQHAVPVLPRRRPGLLVRQHGAAGIFGPEAGQQPEARQPPAVHLERLLEQVHRRLRVLGQQPLRPPAPVRLLDVTVARVAGSSVQDQPHDVPRVTFVERLLVVGRDHVVRRREHLRELAVGHTIPNSCKRSISGMSLDAIATVGRTDSTQRTQRSAENAEVSTGNRNASVPP